jgi:hypothetical protein
VSSFSRKLLGVAVVAAAALGLGAGLAGAAGSDLSGSGGSSGGVRPILVQTDPSTTVPGPGAAPRRGHCNHGDGDSPDPNGNRTPDTNPSSSSPGGGTVSPV